MALAVHQHHSPKRTPSAGFQKAAGSPAKLTLYEENITQQFGTTSQVRPSRITRINIDHLRLDVPSDAMIRELFNLFDTEGKGSIERDYFREVFKASFDNFGAPIEDKDLDRLFAKLDGGNPKAKGKGNGKLNIGEFAILILSRLKL